MLDPFNFALILRPFQVVKSSSGLYPANMSDLYARITPPAADLSYIQV